MTLTPPKPAAKPPASRPALQLDDRYTTEEGRIFLSGVQALVRLPLDLRRRDERDGINTAGFISGYQGSPLGGYDLELGRRKPLLDRHGIVFTPGVNEELAAGAVHGTQLASTVKGFQHQGVFGIWYGKAPGLDRACDALRHANLGGASQFGGALAVVGDDTIPKSSTVPSSSEAALAELGMPVLSPGDPQDVLDLGMHGIALSRFSGLWVGMKIATNVADGSAIAHVSPTRIQPVLPRNDIDGEPYAHAVTGTFVSLLLSVYEASLYGQRAELARRYIAANGLNTIHGAGGEAVVGIAVPGSLYFDVRGALAALGLRDDKALERAGIRLLRIRALFPIDQRQMRDFAAGLSEIVVVEEKRPFLEESIKSALYGMANAPAVCGKTRPDGRVLFRVNSDLPVDDIAAGLASRLAEYTAVSSPRTASVVRQRNPTRRQLPLAFRTPYFCSGCPHNLSTQVPEGSLVGGGIGCHGIAVSMPQARVGQMIGLTQMGGEGSPWIGMSPFVSEPHLTQNLGDGTYHHSGVLAIRAAVAAGVNITYKILFNGAVAMTGGQAISGPMSVPELVKELRAERVAKIVITTGEYGKYRSGHLPDEVDVRTREELVQVQKELAAVPGVTVLIHDQECATELRRKRKRGKAKAPATRLVINERVCEGCGDCGARSNCLSVQPVATEYGRKTRVHQASCNQDFACGTGDCPAFMSVKPGKRAETVVRTPDLAFDASPEPDAVVPIDDFTIRITGIGGTGVVTAGQMISAAATMAGRFVTELDQLGLSQKGGAVVSDIRISREPLARSNKLGAGQADLYLGADVLVAAAETQLQAASANRTVAVVSTAEVPTGAMVTNTGVAFPEADATLGAIEGATRPGAGAYADARALTRALFADDQYANVFLVGMAYQAGALPLPAEDLERAISLNGVQVERNVQAFRRGRQLVANRAALMAVAEGFETQQAGEPTLDELIARRAADLAQYQNAAYAREYKRLVEAVRAAEAEAAPGSSELTRAVAGSLHKLMAYKDEYEVARLMIAPEVGDQLKAQFGEGYSMRWLLHPPTLKALGRKEKVPFRARSRWVFATLASFKRLRGTMFDPFGRTEVRRLERALAAEFQEVAADLAASLTPEGHERAVQIAKLPDMVRGYDELKLKNAAEYRKRLAELSE